MPRVREPLWSSPRLPSPRVVVLDVGIDVTVFENGLWRIVYLANIYSADQSVVAFPVPILAEMRSGRIVQLCDRFGVVGIFVLLEFKVIAAVYSYEN